jgi:hypothetical protein
MPIPNSWPVIQPDDVHPGADQRLLERAPQFDEGSFNPAPSGVTGQEVNSETYAVSKSDTLIKGDAGQAGGQSRTINLWG